MANLALWQMLGDWENHYKWVDLSHELSPETPHWVGWPALQVEEKMNLEEAQLSLCCIEHGLVRRPDPLYLHFLLWISGVLL